MVFLHAYLDASKDEHAKSDRWTVVAGYSGTAEEFARVEERWNGLLALDFKHKEDRHFHYAEFRNRFLDWEERVEKYAKLLSETNLYAIAAIIKNDAWSQLDVSSKYRSLFPRREHACLDFALSTLADALDENALSGPVSLTIDNDYGSRVSATAVFENWEQRTQKTVLALTIAQPGEARLSVPLQYADLLANAVRTDPTTGLEMYELKAEIMNAKLRSPLRHAIKQGLMKSWHPRNADEIVAQAASFNDLAVIPV
ncbi:DUF3800 domain-containing protein [Hyphococcus lacteus]|uniref:DUF3800 domain-containing protein n=1 Tax=Hyphococcus lacteus TaxID=3143536 RepID=A0ABV3Z662_9PROT